ncbi:MAG: hypothetical protein QF619_12300 [Candidatus Binatia bacterium]|nr:hypothetical protein [Candidatus Binatia bacterium]
MAEDFESAIELLKEKGVVILRVEERNDRVFQGKMFYSRNSGSNALETHESRKLGFS